MTGSRRRIGARHQGGTVVDARRTATRTAGLGDWRDYFIGGLLSFILAIILLAWPNATIKVLLLLLGILAIVSGLAALVVGLTGKTEESRRSATIARGVIGLILGVLILVTPSFALTVGLILVGVGSLALGIIDLSKGLRLHQSGRGALLVSGVAWSILGVLLLISAAVQKAAWFIVLLGVVLLIAGICRMLASLVVRRVGRLPARSA
jgi:uncharacterized membrane protein HdeD (DUF308 family)